MEPFTPAIDLDTEGHDILLAASQHDLVALRKLLRTTDTDVRNLVNFQDDDTGQSALHAAISACEEDDEEWTKRGSGATDPVVISTSEVPEVTTNQSSGMVLRSESSEPRQQDLPERIKDSELVRLANAVLKLLLENGAIWNCLDKNNETPGCIALRLALPELYDTMVDAGVRAEMLLNRIDGYEILPGSDDTADEELTGQNGSDIDTTQQDADPVEVEEMPNESSQAPEDREVTSIQFLRSPLVLNGDKLLDEEKNAVMMSWESDIMAQSASLLAPLPGLRILNIGHGMGIIDGFFQAYSPTSHHIIEAHPNILSDMKTKGWYDRQGVTVHEGKWQDVIPKLVVEGITFDAIYFDTFAESYASFREFLSESVIAILEQDGKWGFFNGLGADRQICYDVYGKVVEMDLFEAGYDVEWQEMEVPDLVKDGTWDDVKRSYFALEQYRLPICSFMN